MRVNYSHCVCERRKEPKSSQNEKKVVCMQSNINSPTFFFSRILLRCFCYCWFICPSILSSNTRAHKKRKINFILLHEYVTLNVERRKMKILLRVSLSLSLLVKNLWVELKFSQEYEFPLFCRLLACNFVYGTHQ
jgi:hypothetical protein